MPDFNFRMLYWACICGRKAGAVTVGATEDGDLIGFWHCPKCNKDMAAKISIGDVIAGLPTPARPVDGVEFDKRFLRDFHIKEE